jgi:hypothetical protein
MKANIYKTITAKDASNIMSRHKDGQDTDTIAGELGLNADATANFLEKVASKVEKKSAPKKKVATRKKAPKEPTPE